MSGDVSMCGSSKFGNVTMLTVPSRLVCLWCVRA